MTCMNNQQAEEVGLPGRQVACDRRGGRTSRGRHLKKNSIWQIQSDTTTVPVPPLPDEETELRGARLSTYTNHRTTVQR